MERNYYEDLKNFELFCLEGQEATYTICEYPCGGFYVKINSGYENECFDYGRFNTEEEAEKFAEAYEAAGGYIRISEDDEKSLVSDMCKTLEQTRTI